MKITLLRNATLILESGTHKIVVDPSLGPPGRMPLAEQLEFVRLAPGSVIATHMDALNHCLVSRADLREALGMAGLAERVWIPADGESREYPPA